jgi:hypothetical protein
VLDREGLILKQLELNAQVTRFPSGQEPGFGGQAAYLMRIFGIDGESVTEKTLENTPDIARIAEDGALKAKLAAYVRDHVEAIDTGVYQIPDELLAKKIISFTTFGSARLGNHPFLSLYKPTDFSDLDYAPLKLLRSPEALLERLDNSTCQGCHQSGSTAGFHFIGLDEALDLAAEPHRGWRVAAFPCRAAAPRGLSRGGDARRGAEPFPPAVQRAAGNVGGWQGELRAGRHDDVVHHAGRFAQIRQ